MQVVSISDSVFATRNAWYGKDKLFARTYANVIDEAVQIAKKHLKLPHCPQIVLRNIRQKQTLGVTSPYSQIIEIDPRRINLESILFTLCHELIHLNQIHTKILKTSKDGELLWRNAPHKYSFNPKFASTNNKEYNELPWEADAVKRTPKLLYKISKELELDPDSIIDCHKYTTDPGPSC